mgnify:CR=1 FL=1
MIRLFVPTTQYYISKLLTEGFFLKKQTPAGLPIKGQYMFKTDIIQKVAYSRMLFLQRQKLHRVIAEYLIKNNENNLEAIAPVLAYHWMHVIEGVTDPDQEIVLRAIKCIQQSISLSLSSNQNPADWKAKGRAMAELLSDSKLKHKYTKEFAAESSK